MVDRKSSAENAVDEEGADRRRWDRTTLRKEHLDACLRLSGGVHVDGRVVDLSPGGMRIQVAQPPAEEALRRARVARVTVKSTKQTIFEVDARVVHVFSLSDGSVVVGVSLLAEPADKGRPLNLGDRRAYERIVCELPGTLCDGSGEALATLPVVLTDISETGCRITGVPQAQFPRLGALVELSIQPPGRTPLRVAARVVSPHSDRECGVRFVGGLDRALSLMIAALRYPDLVMATPDHASGIWDVLCAAGYLRERERDRYLALRDGAVRCWSRLSSPEAASLNRSVITADAQGNAKSITQVTRFYPSAWLGHHLAAAGDGTFRRRVVPQHHGNVHDTVESLGADYFLVYYNAQHKGQTSIYTALRDRFPDTEMALNDLVCFDVNVDDTTAPSAASEVGVTQVSPAYAQDVIEWLRTVRDPVSFRALGIERDFALSALERDYERLGMLRRRTWFAARNADGSVAAAASVDIAPPGFNLTSIGNHATLYVGPGLYPQDSRDIRIRALLHYVGDAFRQLDRRTFLLMASPVLEQTLRGFNLRFMAPGQEFVVGAGMFRTLNTFINELYSGRERDARPTRRANDG